MGKDEVKTLTDEQRARAAANRAKALEKRKLKEAQTAAAATQLSQVSTQSFSSPPIQPEANLSSIKRPRTVPSANFEEWARRPVPPEALMEPIEFMQVDIDYATVVPDQRYCPDIPQTTKTSVLRVYGITNAGNSVLAYLHGFEPYFYIECPEELQQDPTPFKEALEVHLSTTGNNRDGVNPFVRNVEVVQRSNIMGWQGSLEHRPYLKVTVALPNMVAASRRAIEAGFRLPDGSILPTQTSFETNIPFTLRFMVDCGMAGGGWVRLSKYDTRSQLSACQIEVDAHYSELVPIDHMHLAPLRILSFDIECHNPEGKGFPKPDSSPVIQIAAYVKEQGQKEPLVHAVWTLNSCEDIAGSLVFSHDREEDLLLNFQEFLRQVDPDVITGYNIGNFDLPYLLDRAEVKNIASQFCRLGRLGEKTKKRESKTQNGRESWDINIEGRIQFDMLQVIQKQAQLSSYSLNAVSAHFLKEQKEDVHYSMIGDLFKTSSETRRRLAVYCLKDAYLPLRLLDELCCMYNYVEMARVTGTPINFLLNRGQMIKVQSQLLRKAREHGFVLPTLKTQASEEKFEGATVLEPDTGYYAHPIATLDFASLYPSIMMAHNLCYCTLLKLEDAEKLGEENVTRTPAGCVFLKATTRRGLLPMILEELLAARKKAKKEMAAATDPLMKSVLNGRQLALKISANSVYGFTGATVGVLPCLEISSSVTSFGRTMIEATKSKVEEHFTIANGYKHDAKVIYGDTDSVMVKFGTESIAEAMELGTFAAGMVSETFLRPIKLEFEKVYCPYLLMNKKRYAGLYWTRPEDPDKMDCKGIETVRRDNCQLVRQVVETCLNMLLSKELAGKVEGNKETVEAAVQYVQGTISDLLLNKVDLSLLVITKSLGKGANAEDYAAKQAHVELAERMRKRDPSTAPGSGDRVAYVILSGSKGAKAYEKSEDPLYALEHNLPVDAQYYIEHLKQPLLRIFGPIMGDDKKAESKLFSGAHTRRLHTPTPHGGALARFVTRGLRCMGCKAVIKEGSLCSHCQEEKATEVIIERMQELQLKELEYNQLWTQCQRCQGSLLEEVICANRDCDIFYRRARAKKDVQQATEQMCRFREADW